jgi:putative transposase DNA-binding domain family
MKFNKTKDTVFRMYKTKGPDLLLPLYNILQRELDRILATPTYVEALSKIEFKYKNENGKEQSKLNGMLWSEIHEIIGESLKGKVPDAWYLRILYHNIISLLKSRQEQIKIYEILKANQYKIDSTLRDKLVQEKLYPTNSYLETLAAAKDMPVLPKRKTFILDFSVSDKQMFRVGKNSNAYEIKIHSKKEVKAYNLETGWISFEMFLPTYIRESFTGKTAKPQFYWDHNKEEFVCAIPCEIKKLPNEYENVMGVDLGKIKVYSATVVRKDGSISDEYVPTEELQNLVNKLKRMNQHIKSVYEKKKRSSKYDNFTERQTRRKLDYKRSKNKRTKLQLAIARLVAVEVVNIAIKEQCKEIHLENLSWVKSSGGKWNFAQMQARIEEVAELFSIKIVKVNTKNSSKTNPVTLEVGKISNRDVLFKDGQKVDRDQLAGLNLALREPKKQKQRKIKTLNIRDSIVIQRQSRRFNNYLMKKSVMPEIKSKRKIHKEFLMAKQEASKPDLIKKENKKIVMFSHDKAKSDFAIMSVYKSSNLKLEYYFTNNLQFKNIYSDL